MATVVHLPPHVFAVLPPKAAAYFEKLGCTVPQPTPDPFLPLRMENAIGGSFARQGQIDYAILCAIDRRSHIEVFWGGPAKCPTRTEPGVAGEQVDTIDADGQYAEVIAPIGPRQIDEYRRAFGGPRLPERNHLGIDQYDGKGSVVHYCARGAWHVLTGMD